MVHSVGHLDDETAHKHLNAVHLVNSARDLLMHLDSRPLILVHLLNANIVTLLLLAELMTKFLELIRHSLHKALQLDHLFFLNLNIPSIRLDLVRKLSSCLSVLLHHDIDLLLDQFGDVLRLIV